MLDPADYSNTVCPTSGMQIKPCNRCLINHRVFASSLTTECSLCCSQFLRTSAVVSNSSSALGPVEIPCLPAGDRGVSALGEPGHRPEGCGPFSPVRLRSDGWNQCFVALPTRSFPCPMILLKLAEETRLLFYDEKSQPKSKLTESLYIRFVNDFTDDYSCHMFFPVIFSPVSLWTRRATDPSLPDNGCRHELNHR